MRSFCSGAMGSPMWAEKPGWVQAKSLLTSSGEMAWASTSLASSRSRKRLMSRAPFHSGRGCHEPSAVFPPSVVRRWTWGCHWTRSPAVAIETTTPGRASSPRPLRTSSATASAAARPSSVSSARRLRRSGRSSRGMVRTTWRWGTAASTCWHSHSAQTSWRFFSHEGQKERPRQEKATSTLRRHSAHHSRAKPCSSSPQRRNSRNTRSTTGRSGPCRRVKRVGQTRSSSSRCRWTSWKSGESRGLRGR
jgi:hypothetical protein